MTQRKPKRVPTLVRGGSYYCSPKALDDVLELMLKRQADRAEVPWVSPVLQKLSH